MSTRRLTVGQALVEFVSMRRQAEAFARAVGGSPCEGAQGDDAIAAQRVAARATDALARGIAAAARDA